MTASIPNELTMDIDEAVCRLRSGLQESLAADLVAGQECRCHRCGERLRSDGVRLLLEIRRGGAALRFRAVCDACQSVEYAIGEGRVQ